MRVFLLIWAQSVKIYTNFSDKPITQDNAYEFETLSDFKKALGMFNDLGFYDPEYEPDEDEDEDKDKDE